MKLGTHNSITYLEPQKWYMKPFQFIAKCQNKTIEEQYNSGVRLFDIRVSFTDEGLLEFRHGLMKYKGNVYDIFNKINSFEESCYVRLWLEITKEDIYQEGSFKRVCKLVEEKYPNIKFFDGKRKFDQRTIYQFKYSKPLTKEVYASYQLPKIDDLWPWLYAKIHNKKAKAEEDEYLMLDFI